MTEALLQKYGFTQIPALTTVGIVFSLIISIGLPITLLIIWRVKTKANVSMFFIGAATFISFALLLEKLIQASLFAATGDTITGNIFLLALVGGLFAGVFEEVGRYIAMLIFMTGKKKTKENSIMLGIGHGGIEAIILLGFAEISNLVTVAMLNSGLLQTSLGLSEAVMSADLLEQNIAALAPLWTENPILFFLGGIERIFAISFHICMSYLVYRGYRDRKVVKLLLAIALHTLYDGIMLLINSRFGATVTEIYLAICAVAIVIYTINVYRKDNDETVVTATKTAENPDENPEA